MEKITEFLNPERVNTLIGVGMKALLALVFLIIGLWLAKRVQNLIIKLSSKSPHLDPTLFKFLASIVRFVIIAFVVIGAVSYTHLTLPTKA